MRNWNGGKVGKVKISLKPGVSATGATDIRADGRLNSFLGEYDRELDEDVAEPLEFEEQFILRVPKEVEMGRGGEIGLREMIKGKGKGLEGIEFKFMGTSQQARTAMMKADAQTLDGQLSRSMATPMQPALSTCPTSLKRKKRTTTGICSRLPIYHRCWWWRSEYQTRAPYRRRLAIRTSMSGLMVSHRPCGTCGNAASGSVSVGEPSK